MPANQHARYRNVLSYFFRTPWAILPAKLAELRAILWARISATPLPPEMFNLNISPTSLRDSLPRAAEEDAPAPEPEDESPDDEPEEDEGTAYAVGDRVRIAEGMEREDAPAGATGEVVEISTPALGIRFDGSDAVAHWFTDDEVEPEDGPAEPEEDAEPAPADARKRRRNPKASGRISSSLPLSQGLPSNAPARRYQLVGACAVINITGTITPRPSMFDEWSGGTSHEFIGAATNEALADGQVEAIIYSIDSPGGVVFGMPETGDIVSAAGKEKSTYGIANHVAASAAYWYLAQMGATYITPAGTVGAIGVLMGSTDETKALEMAGIKDVLVSNTSSPYKGEGYPQVPITDEHVADMVRTCDAYMAMFTSAVARGRKVQEDRVIKDFGRGRMLLAADAVAAGMVDKIDTLDGLVQTVTGPKTRAARREIAAQLVKGRLPTAGPRS